MKLCSKCNHPGIFGKKTGSADGLQYWCNACKARSMRNKRSNGFVDVSGNKVYRKFKKETCERCGFVPEHRCQLDVDHVDGNHFNNDLNNLQTLCANCHRVKTYINRNIKQRKVA